MPKQIIPVSGLHCRSCEILIAEELQSIDGVKSAKVSYHKSEAEIEFDGQAKTEDFHRAIIKAGYRVGKEELGWVSRDGSQWRDLLFAALLVGLLLVIAIFSGLNLQPNLAGTPESLLGVLLIGLAAGFSTCMALTGGLLLGLSAKYAAQNPSASIYSRLLPQTLFNLGRLIAYAILGGIIGLIGSAITISPLFWAALTIIVSIVMLILGLQLINVFPKLSRLSLSLPNWLKIGKSETYSHFGALLLGALTFFLPCGFTQAMQLYAVSSGGFFYGLAIMLTFAVGTLPGLLLAGLAGSLAKGIWGKRLFKFIGLLIIVFAFYNLSNSWNLLGIGNWGNSADNSSCPINSTSSSCSLAGSAATQLIRITYTAKDDINPSIITVKANQPVRLEITPLDSASGCMSTIMIPGLYDKAVAIVKDQPIKMEFTPKRTGSFPITCAMGVKRGTLIVE